MNKYLILSKLKIFWLYLRIFDPARYKVAKKFQEACKSDEVQFALKYMVDAVFNKVIDESKDKQE